MSSAQTLPASAPAGPRPRSRVWLTRFAWAVLVYNVPVILWGAVVRATGSGAGCGDHWPLCNGVLIQAHPRLATMIELSHRVSSAVSVIAILALLLWTFLATPRRHIARITAVAAAIFIFNEALLGALLVLLKLTANNDSPERAFYLSLHLANTLLLLAALALSAHFLSRKSGFERGALRYANLAPGILGLTATLMVGVSGTLAALGDTLFPAASLRTAFSQDLSQHSSWLIRLRIVHPLSALIAGLFIAWLVAQSFSRGSRAPHSLAKESLAEGSRTPGWRNPSSRGPNSADRKLGIAVLLLLLLQYGLGLLDVALLTPVWTQVMHLLGADLLWIVLVILAARICVRSEDACGRPLRRGRTGPSTVIE